MVGDSLRRDARSTAINQLEPGDAILMGDGTSSPAIYRVADAFIVNQRDVWIMYDNEEAIVTFFACHPPRLRTSPHRGSRSAPCGMPIQ